MAFPVCPRVARIARIAGSSAATWRSAAIWPSVWAFFWGSTSSSPVSSGSGPRMLESTSTLNWPRMRESVCSAGPLSDMREAVNG